MLLAEIGRRAFAVDTSLSPSVAQKRDLGSEQRACFLNTRGQLLQLETINRNHSDIR